jgi:hypothetical protein
MYQGTTKDAWNSSCYLDDKTSRPDSATPDFCPAISARLP